MAFATIELHGEMSTQATCMSVRAPEQAAMQDGRATDARSQRHHHNVLYTPSGACKLLTHQR
jgi:hypothetical protein